MKRLVAVAVVLALGGCSTLGPDEAADTPPGPEARGGAEAVGPGAADTGPVLEEGIASWYGLPFHGRRTASGERFDMNALTAAHPSLPFGSRVLVRNPQNGRSVVVRINDRGPFVRGRIIDLSHAAARALGMLGLGTRKVVLHLVESGQRPAPAAPF